MIADFLGFQFINGLKPQILQKYHPSSDHTRRHLNYEEREKLRSYFAEDSVLGKRRAAIAEDIGIPEQRVSSWWQRQIYKNGYSGSASGPKRKLWFSKEEKDLLKLYFDENYELGDRRYTIADELDVTVERVVTWWANRKMFLKNKGVDIPNGSKTPLAQRTKVGFQINSLKDLSLSQQFENHF